MVTKGLIMIGGGFAGMGLAIPFGAGPCGPTTLPNEILFSVEDWPDGGTSAFGLLAKVIDPDLESK